jgi:alpha-mannosidase
MRSSLRFLAPLAIILANAFLDRGAEPAQEAGKGTFWIIPHTHWEGAVFKTREEYLDMGLPHILQALRLLKTQPTYRFVLDQVAYIKPFLERYPEEAVAFRKFVAEGRLQIVLGMDIMPDVNMPGGETFLRQMQYGKGYCRDQLGVNVTTCWLIDTFGHHAQLPQLLRKAGYQSFWFSRGVPGPDHPSEFLWEGIDGTRIPAFWLPHSYGLMYSSPRDLPGFRRFVKQRFDLLASSSRSLDRAGLSGADVSEPEEHLAPLIEAYNRQADVPLNLRLAVPSDFEAVVARRRDLPVFRGELNPIFQGTYSSRIELKQKMRTLERLLTTAEKLGVLAERLGTPIDDRTLWRAWEPVLFNETHDLASGVMTDHVYEDTLRSYSFAERLANEFIDMRWQRVVARIDTRGDGFPLVVFNTLGWPRTDIAEATVGFSEPGIQSITLVDSTGQAVPTQLMEATRHSDGGLKTARIAFLARDVPALGYSVYHGQGQREGDQQANGSAMLLENEFWRLTVDPTTGALTSLVDKASGGEFLSGPANVIARETDRGDLWELYRGLDGGSKFAMKQKQPVPRSGAAKLTTEFPGKQGTLRTGPVFCEFQIAHPFDTGTFATVVRLCTGKRRIEIRTTLVNNEKFVRYQALFPTTISAGKNVHAIPFGAMERPTGIEFPAQEWVDYGDGRQGLALLNVGLPGNSVTDGTLMVSLLRAHTLGAYGFGGGYEPGMTSDTGFQLGKPRTLHYALLPHRGDWRAARVYREAMEINHPLLVNKTVAHDGKLPKRWGLLEVTHPAVVVSALKPGRDGSAILRIYEAAGSRAKDVSIKLRTGLLSARECDLLEEAGADLKTEDDTLHCDLGPFEVKTIELRFR